MTDPADGDRPDGERRAVAAADTLGLVHRLTRHGRVGSLAGVSRLSMPDAAQAKQVTGYERGTITPLGSLTPPF